MVTSFDYKSKRLEVLTDLPDIKQGSKVTSFGTFCGASYSSVTINRVVTFAYFLFECVDFC